MIIRTAIIEDLEEMKAIYAHARLQMKLNGNPNQWKDYWPDDESIIEHINNHNSYVMIQDDEMVGCFAFIIGRDPTYEIIEQGAWLNDDEYGTIHQIASNNKVKDILEIALEFCSTFGKDIRIDTHEDNKIMLHLLEKYGFTRCGLIHTHDNSLRIAFQKTKEELNN